MCLEVILMFKIGEKVRFQFGICQTRVGTIKKVKVGWLAAIFGVKYLVTVESPLSVFNKENNIYWYYVKEKEIIEKVPDDYKGYL
jgi:hypothetical protein